MDKDKSRIGKATANSPELRNAIFSLGESKTLDEALVVINAPKAEGGYGITVDKSALSAWLNRERLTRTSEAFILKLKRGNQLLDEAATTIATSSGAKYDAGILAAVREYTLNLVATGQADAKDIFMLTTALAQNGKAKLEIEKLALEHRRLALQEKKLAQEILAKAAEIQIIRADRSLDNEEKLARVQTLLFGEKPADVPTLAEKGRAI